MKAMIFAAGLGTRLRPLTDQCPKALMKINGIPLLDIAIGRLRAAGVTDIIINIHHLGEQILNHLASSPHLGLNIAISDERDLLLDTGGGLKKAAWFFDDQEPFLVYNADILTTLSLEEMVRAHRATGALATLAVRDRSSSRMLLFSPEGVLCGWQNTQTGLTRISREAPTYRALAFSGIHVIDPVIFNYFPEGDIFSIIEVYLSLAAKKTIRAYQHDDDVWLDVGKPDQLAKAQDIWV